MAGGEAAPFGTWRGLLEVMGRPTHVGPVGSGQLAKLAKTLGLALPVLRVVDRLYADMVAHGDGELDHSGIIREIRRFQGLPVTDCV